MTMYGRRLAHVLRGMESPNPMIVDEFLRGSISMHRGRSSFIGLESWMRESISRF